MPPHTFPPPYHTMQPCNAHSIIFCYILLCCSSGCQALQPEIVPLLLYGRSMHNKDAYFDMFKQPATCFEPGRAGSPLTCSAADQECAWFSMPLTSTKGQATCAFAFGVKRLDSAGRLQRMTPVEVRDAFIRGEREVISEKTPGRRTITYIAYNVNAFFCIISSDLVDIAFDADDQDCTVWVNPSTSQIIHGDQRPTYLSHKHFINIASHILPGM